MTASSARAVFKALTNAGVRFVVVGGLAVNVYGYLRLTLDIDLVVHLTWEGSRREQIERWAKLTLDEILDAQEEMAELARELAGSEGPGSIAAGAHGDRTSEPPAA